MKYAKQYKAVLLKNIYLDSMLRGNPLNVGLRDFKHTLYIIQRWSNSILLMHLQI